MVRVKICGITNINDAKNAVFFGADALGFVFAESPRKISKETARSIIKELPPFVTCVGLFVDEDVDIVKEVCRFCKIHTVQFHGNETPDYLECFPEFKIIKAFRIRDKSDLLKVDSYHADAYLLDSFSKEKMGGTGLCFDWNILKTAKDSNSNSIKFQNIIIAGGLNPGNVAEAIHLTNPYGVDTSSGVEITPGVKDKNLIKRFINTAKQ